MDNVCAVKIESYMKNVCNIFKEKFLEKKKRKKKKEEM